MTKDYYLLGKLWDKKALPDSVEFINGIPSQVFDYRQGRNLFDINQLIRSIKSSELFEIEAQDELNQIINILKNCNKTYIVIDNEPSTKTEIVQLFYAHRVLQIYKEICTSCEGNQVVIVASDNVRKHCYSILNK